MKNEQTERLGQNEAVIKMCEANVRLARLNLSYCAIIATCDGVTGRKDIHVGQLVQPGQTMVEIVDSKEMVCHRSSLCRTADSHHMHTSFPVYETATLWYRLDIPRAMVGTDDATGLCAQLRRLVCMV